MTWWADANARARGLGTHLLDDAAWRRLRTAPDLFVLCRELERLGYPVEPGGEARSAERAVEQVRRERQSRILRWLGPRSRHVRFLLEDDDRRAIRSLLRGAAAELTPPERLSVTPPSCGLTAGMVERAARADTPDDCLELLAAQGQPLALAAIEERDGLLAEWPETPTLLAHELALVRARAARAVEGGKRGGTRLNRVLALTLDLQNAWSALVLVKEPAPSPDLFFVEGGAALSQDAFREALEAGDPAEARATLARVLPAPVGEPFADSSLASGRLERATLILLLRQQRRQMLHEPLGPAPLLAFLLQLRLETHDLRGLLWARALGAPLELPEVA
ncbi:MAG: V-type ATPase subunit [Gemmatimonadota bacterium]|nr:V-type ATPase subunit [Gemmatimonadota bacterium]